MGMRSKGRKLPISCRPTSLPTSAGASSVWRNATTRPLPSGASSNRYVDRPAWASRLPTAVKIASRSSRCSAWRPASASALKSAPGVGACSGRSGAICGTNWANPASASRSGRKNQTRPIFSAGRRPSRACRRTTSGWRWMAAATCSTDSRFGSLSASETNGCVTRRFTAPCNEGRSAFLRLTASGSPLVRSDAGAPDHPGHGRQQRQSGPALRAALHLGLLDGSRHQWRGGRPGRPQAQARPDPDGHRDARHERASGLQATEIRPADRRAPGADDDRLRPTAGARQDGRGGRRRPDGQADRDARPPGPSPGPAAPQGTAPRPPQHPREPPRDGEAGGSDRIERAVRRPGRHDRAGAGPPGPRLLGLDAEDQEVAFHAGLLHDIGQIGLPEELLNKQGRYTPEEFAQIQKHTILGAEFAGPFRPATVLAPAIRHHHERWDGTGYPDKLQGPAIPMMARIVAVADAFHAMITDRPYRPKHTVAKTLEILAAGSGTQWDPRLVAAFATSSLPQRIAGAVESDQAKIA